jgi:hypothetical protein
VVVPVLCRFFFCHPPAQLVDTSYLVRFSVNEFVNRENQQTILIMQSVFSARPWAL